MTYRYLKDLDKAVAASGLKIVLIDGWQTRGRPTSFDFDPKGIVVHHTGSPLNGRVGCNILIAGRKDLPAPLAQLSLDREGTVYVVAAGRSNHAGEVITKGFIRRGDGNAQSIGVEAQNTGAEGWTPVQLDAYHRLCASVNDYYGWSRANVLGHGEVSTSGKWDPGHQVGGKNKMIDMTEFRLQVAAVTLGKPATPKVAVWANPASFILGATGPDVTRLGERLVIWAKALKLPAPYLEGPGPEFTPTDLKAVQRFQLAQGWTGADADGYPGPETLRRLLLTPKPPIAAKPRKVVRISNISANVAGYNSTQGTGEKISEAEQDRLSVKRVPALGKALESFRADIIDLQECSAAMVPYMDRALPSYNRAPGKGLGRVIFVHKDLFLKSGGAGSVKSRLNGDDKPYAWAHYLKDGEGFVSVSGHTENQDGADKKTKRSSDLIRVDQGLEYIAAGERICEHYNLSLTRLEVSMDGNSYDAVRVAAGKRGFASAAKVAIKKVNDKYRTHTGWGSTKVLAPQPGSHFDMTLVRDDPRVVVEYWGAKLDNKLSDHNITRTIRTIQI